MSSHQESAYEVLVRKRPIEVTVCRAINLIQAARGQWDHLPDWITAAYDDGKILFLRNCITIQTLEGSMVAQPADWIIRGVQGEIYPCKPDIFKATYERVDGQPI